MKAILIDDELLALDYLEIQIKKVSNIEVSGKYSNFELEEDDERVKEVDIVFLDIEMPEVNGLELAEQILEVNPNITIVFVTAFTNYAVRAFEVDALDYILKPVQKDRLKITLDRIEKKLKNTPSQPLSVEQTLYINVCDELTFFLKDNLEILNWRTAKAQELFLYMLQQLGKTVQKSELIEILWKESEPKKAYALLYNAIYHVRKALSKYSDHITIKSVQDGYMLLAHNISIDIKEWEERLAAAPLINNSTVKDYEAIMHLYKGAYLHKYDYLWIESERYRLEQLWKKIAYQLANFYKKQEDLEKAEIWYVKICAQLPEEEEAHFSLMKLYATLGLGLLVDHQYNRLNQAMEELGIQVSLNIQQWYEEWKQTGRSSLIYQNNMD